MDLRNGVCDEFLRSQPGSVKQRSHCTRAPDGLSFIIFIVQVHLKLLNHFIIQHSLRNLNLLQLELI